jgi:hypothetical protein
VLILKKRAYGRSLMKKFMFFCYLASVFFLISGCPGVDVLVGAIDKSSSQGEEVIKVHRDVVECVWQSSKAGFPYKPCPFSNPMSLFTWDFAFLHASKEHFAQKMLQEYNLDPVQKKFVEDCLLKKGYRKEYLEPRAWWQSK